MNFSVPGVLILRCIVMHNIAVVYIRGYYSHKKKNTIGTRFCNIFTNSTATRAYGISSEIEHERSVILSRPPLISLSIEL